MSGQKPFERILIRPDSFWRERKVALRLGSEVTAIDAGARTVTTDDGMVIAYGHLIWAAGGRPRRLT